MQINKKVLNNDIIIKAVDTDNFTVIALVSNNKLDADREVILNSAWKNFKRYKANPVFMSSHDIYSLGNVIGKCLEIKKTGEGVECKFQYFVGEGNEIADWAWVLAKKQMAAFSVGFLTKTKERETSAIMELLKKENIALPKNEKIWAVITDAELYEVSQVAVGANKDALQKSKSINLKENDDIDKIYDELMADIKSIYDKLKSKNNKENEGSEDIEKNVIEVKNIDLDSLIEKIVVKKLESFEEKFTKINERIDQDRDLYADNFKFLDDSMKELKEKEIKDIYDRIELKEEKVKKEKLYQDLLSNIENYKID